LQIAASAATAHAQLQWRVMTFGVNTAHVRGCALGFEFEFRLAFEFLSDVDA